LREKFWTRRSTGLPKEPPPAQTEDSANSRASDAFGDDHFTRILPSYLSDSDKSRLKEGLEQFFPENSAKEIKYDQFYQDDLDRHFKQADLIAEIRCPNWNEVSRQYDISYPDAMLLTNTCDISPDNQRNANIKQCLFAPIISLTEYILDLKENGYTDSQIKSFGSEVKRQKITNIFYLPPYQTSGSDYIVLLDYIFQFPAQELTRLLPDISEERLKSLSNFGFYLFIFKLSYHLCRLPEEPDRLKLSEL
jgi:hypothetical protein